MKSGVADYAANLANALAEDGHRVKIVTSRCDSIAHSDLVSVRAAVPSWDFRSAGIILRELREANADVVNIQYPTEQYGRHTMVNLLPWLVRSRLGVPSVATVHEFDTYTRLGRARLALTARLSNAVILTVAANRSSIQPWAGGSAAKYSVVPLGSNLSYSPPAHFDRDEQRGRLGAGPHSVVLAFFGFVGRHKQLDVLLNAFAAAQDSATDVDLRLWLLADRQPLEEDSRPYYAALERQLSTFTHRHRVVWTGYLSPDEASAYLLSADIGVFPFSDGVSMRRSSLLAALSHGLPTIGTLGPHATIDGLSEEAGLFLVPPSDVDVLARAILMLARDRQLRDSAANRAKRFAGTLSWPSIARRTLAVYQDALGDRRDRE
jgi:glycosyltransferase involved in cell wall biosynthesis